MSTLSAALTVVAVLAFSGTAAYYQIRRAQTLCENERAQVIGTGRISGSFAPATRPASETRPGTDFAEQDALELLYSLPDYDELAAGRDRLWQAIHDDQAKGEQQ
ncbi:hypothetical protein [Streptomyces prunicolor]